VLICGGGTGGHVYPALAVVEALRADAAGGAEVLYVGSAGSVEERLAGGAGIAFESVESGQMRGKAPWTVARSLIKTGRGVMEAGRIISSFRPSVVFSTGGYASAPVLLAARRAGVPALIYLPDVEPGMTIKLLGRLAQRVAVSFEEVQRFFPAGKTLVSGYPVRSMLREQRRDEARSRLGLHATAPVVLAFGGSQGAHSLNRAVLAGLPALTGLGEVVHVSGQRDAEWVAQVAATLPPAIRSRYHSYAYLDGEMLDALAAADLIVARAGASTLGEFPAVGVPSILVPYPYSGQHQYANARYMERYGAAAVIDDLELDRHLVPTVQRILGDEGLRRRMAEGARSLANPEAARILVQELRRLAGEVGDDHGHHLD
jgi:UDP-N-acetylglucosamine--N-acetylmuramyl-(pentapeptide) pyrophosphoryl-undecaprenol N-acetylglucosamine transferase